MTSRILFGSCILNGIFSPIVVREGDDYPTEIVEVGTNCSLDALCNIELGLTHEEIVMIQKLDKAFMELERD